MTVAIAILASTAWLAALLFIARFIVTTWFRRAAGILTMAFLGSAFSVLSLAVMTILFGNDWPGRELVRLGVYALVNVFLWSGLVTLVRDQRRGRARVHTGL